MQNTRILIVEDESIVAKDIERSLIRMGYEVVDTCDSGEEAVSKAEVENPDMILMDIVLAGDMDGTTAAMMIREKLRLPVIYLTAYTDDATLKKARMAEPFAYIPKPFDERELHAAIEMAIYKSHIERQEHEQKEWLATTLSCIGDGVIASDRAGRVTFMNPLAEALTGWSQQDAVGNDIPTVFHAVWEASMTPAKNPVQECMEEDCIYEMSRPTLLLATDGMQRHIEFNAAPIRNGDGAITGAVLAFRDVSEKREAAEALRQSEEQLRQSQKMDAVGRLAGGIAHDFNNMLTAIMGYSRLALDEREDVAAVRDDLQQILRTGERAADLTKQLLAFSRRQILPARPLNLNEAVEDITSVLGRTLTESIELDIQLDEDVLGVKAEPSQLQQMIMNLTINARDAMPHGGKLTIRTGHIKLDDHDCVGHAVDRPGEYVMLVVGDTGCGMMDEVREHAFEPFFTTKEQGKGTGLGLSTVYGIAKQFNGFIDLRSEPHVGTEFTIYLPRVVAPVAMQHGSEHEALPRGTETILLAEDEEMIINLAARLLRSLGYRVLQARDGLEAQELSRDYHKKIDLMITDLVMPRLGGYQLAETLTRERPEMKVLLISGYTEETISRHGGLDPDTPFLPKPFNPRELAQKVRSVLDAQPVEPPPDQDRSRAPDAG